jgi:ribosome recycling factor
MKFVTTDYEEKMKKTLTAYESNLATIRAGQANPSVLAKVTFEYWGSQTPISTMADIRTADAKTVTITPFDASTLKAMSKAILASDVGITPVDDGKVIRLVFPQPTEERRKELCKQVQKQGEDAKVALRNIRRDAIDAAKKQKKDSLLTEDEEKAAEKSIQELTDKYIKSVDTITAHKEKDIMEI